MFPQKKVELAFTGEALTTPSKLTITQTLKNNFEKGKVLRPLFLFLVFYCDIKYVIIEFRGN